MGARAASPLVTLAGLDTAGPRAALETNVVVAHGLVPGGGAGRGGRGGAAGAGVGRPGVPAAAGRAAGERAVHGGGAAVHGRPIRYAYTERDQPLAAYRTLCAAAGENGDGSAEMPSAGRPFTARTVTELVRAGVQCAPVTLRTGVASAEAHEPPHPERYAVSPHAAWLVNAVRAGGGRVIAVGTTAVRALESAVGPDGRVRAASGWTGLEGAPERGGRVVDGLLTGLPEPEASHLLMLEAVAGAAAVEHGYEAAVRARLLWHEFGDVHPLTEGVRAAGAGRRKQAWGRSPWAGAVQAGQTWRKRPTFPEPTRNRSRNALQWQRSARSEGVSCEARHRAQVTYEAG
ncbi:S-adenosylmethionine:tRNA ribosyltransferase-isomerase [Streptomyces albidoflavus]|uniref:S-adenosylmethionine:tRNA ribosyltransferase-isomerase n=1 Tax=Streptomyces TaxID=1883 RepID=UPI001E4C9B93|nr:S-adenosylmethionine:tRNA ribosyltransferase-isomerase [Streptomyces albidoflavus]